MNTYNKNSSNQSGVTTDNIIVNNQAVLPNINIDQSNLTFTNKIIANAGLQLPSSTYSITSNMLGYQPTVTIYPNRVVIPTGVDNYVASVTLTQGIYLVCGQIENFAYLTTNYSYSSISISTNINENKLISNSIRHSNFMQVAVGNNFIQEISRIINVTTTTTYYLISYFTASSNGIVLKTTDTSTTSNTIASSQTGTSISITASNSNIKIGMIVTGNNINQPCYVNNNVSTTITLTTSQTISANTTLTFSFSGCATSFSATRIA